MTAIKTPSGFSPARSLTGSNTFSTRRFEKDGTVTGAGAVILPGDPVKLTANGKVARFTATDFTTNSAALLGIAAGVENADGRIKDNTPTQHGSVSLSADTTDLVNVYVDPNLVYSVAVDVTAATTTLIGNTLNVAYGTQNLKLGRSGARVAVAGVSADQTGPFQVIGLSESVVFTDVTQEVEVVLNSGIFNGTASI